MTPAPHTLAVPSADIEVHDLASLPRARLDDWLTLFAARPDAGFQHHPDWFAAIDAHLLPGAIRVASARDTGGPLALLPLASDAAAREAHHPRHPHLALADVLLHPRLGAADARALVERLAWTACPRAEAWRIADLPAGSALAGALGIPDDDPRARAEAGVGGGHDATSPDSWAFRPSRPSAHFDLNDGHEAVPGKLRRNLRRLRRRLEAEGPLRVERVRSPDALPAAWERFLAVEASGWKGAGAAGTAIAVDATLAGFYGALLAPRSPGLVPEIDLLWLDERCIAAQLGLEVGGTLSLMKIGYDERHAAAAPGSLLLEAVLAEAAADGLGLGRLSLVTSPAWAARWHPAERGLWHAVRYADTIGGRRRRALDRLRDIARKRLRR